MLPPFPTNPDGTPIDYPMMSMNNAMMAQLYPPGVSVICALSSCAADRRAAILMVLSETGQTALHCLSQTMEPEFHAPFRY